MKIKRRIKDLEKLYMSLMQSEKNIKSKTITVRSESQHDTVNRVSASIEACKGLERLRNKYKKLSESDKWYHPEDTVLWYDVYKDLDDIIKKIEEY